MAPCTRTETIVEYPNLSSDPDALEAHLKQATDAILALQKEEGFWEWDFESDATYAAEYIFTVRFLGETPNVELEQKMGCYLRRIQLPDGGWPVFANGPTSVNSSVMGYLALKMIGDSPEEEHMVRARKAIMAAGGAEASNKFIRIRLALQGIIPWDAIPLIPVEIMFLPQWFPFHLSKVACWSRTVIVPLAVLSATRAVGKPHGIRIDELFNGPPEKVALPPRGPHHSIVMHSFFSAMNTALLMVQPYIPSSLRQRAIDKAVAWLEERIRPGEGLYGASFNSINALLLFAALGYPADHPTRVILRDFIESLVLVREKEAYLQVVRSPMWDTTVVAHALLETQEPHAKKAAMRGLEWLRPRQILDVRGDWTYTRPHLLPGGWPFQFGNSVYPDVDDTVVTVMAMHRADPEAFAEAIKRGRDWAIGMQSHNGGWGTYDADNDHHWLNQIPFADHGFLIDDQTADVTGRCLSLLGQLGELPATSEAARRGMEFVLKKQEPDGKWWCQWGLNYTHGAWSALSGLNALGVSHDDPRVKLAVEFLVSVQNEDGGWGEDGITYERGCYVTAPSAPTQTAWALLALMAGGAARLPAVARGVEWLLRTQCDHGLWEEESYQGACAPSLPFLRYHGYCKYFPLWALARYRNLKRDGVTRVSLGL